MIWGLEMAERSQCGPEEEHHREMRLRRMLRNVQKM